MNVTSRKRGMNTLPGSDTNLYKSNVIDNMLHP